MRSQPAVNGVGVLPIDLNLFKNWEFDIVVFINKFPDLFGSAWLLTLELVAWESQNFKSFILEFLSDLVELLIIGISVSALTCYIYNQESLAVFVFGK